MRLARYLALRLALIVPVLLGVVVLTFVLVRVLPGDPVQAFVSPSSTAEDIAAIRARLGLDVSLWQQFLDYAGGLLTGDLGTSIQSGTPVTVELATRLAPTLELVVLAVVIALAVSLVLGIRSAARAGRPTDQITRVGSLSGPRCPSSGSGSC